jgi:hypothetical protein
MNRQTTEYIRRFTVEILQKGTEKSLGTGFVISSDGLVITCSHILEMAGMDLERDDFTKFDKLIIRFPERDQEEEVVCRASVVAYRLPEEDDVALIKIDDLCPLGPESVAFFIADEPEFPCDFVSHGFRERDEYNGMTAIGKVVGKADNKKGSHKRHDRLVLQSDMIDEGMSGAPVAILGNDNFYRIAGIVAQTYDSCKSFKDAQTSIAVNSLVLAKDPFNEHFDFQKEPFHSLELPLPSADRLCAQKAISYDLHIEWNDAPKTPSYWVKRDCIIEALADDWKDRNKRLISLIGDDGMGKTTLARRWIEDLLDDWWPELPKPKCVFYWDFYSTPYMEDFFESALYYLSGGNINQNQFRSLNAKMDFLSQMIIEFEKQNRSLFVLDGFEAMQHHEKETGAIISTELKQFIAYLTYYGHCMIISTTTIKDFSGDPRHSEHKVSRLTKHESRKLLQNLGVMVSKDDADTYIRKCKGDPSFICLIANTISSHKK